MKLHIQSVIDKITGYMQAAARRGDHEASNAYDNALGCVQSLLDVYHSDEPFLIGLSYTDYRPGMRIYMHTDYEHIKADEVIEIAEINGYDLESATYLHPKDRDLHFITTDGSKIIWNQVPISCFIELDQTTVFLREMFDYYRKEADKRLNSYTFDWNKADYEQFVEEKHDHLLELLIAYEHKRCEVSRKWKMDQTQIS